MRQSRNNFGYQIVSAMMSPEKREEHLKIAREAITEFQKAMDTYESTPFTPRWKKLTRQQKL